MPGKQRPRAQDCISFEQTRRDETRTAKGRGTEIEGNFQGRAGPMIVVQVWSGVLKPESSLALVPTARASAPVNAEPRGATQIIS